MARRLGFRNEDSFDRWLKKHRALPESDPRHLRKGIRSNNFTQLNRIRQVDKRWKGGAERVLEKKHVLVDQLDKMTNFNFLDRYQDQIKALLQDPNVTQYRKRQLRKMVRQLRSDINTEPGQLVLPIWRQ